MNLWDNTMAAKSKEETFILKARVKELEGQVGEYKKKLDDLRKAKNTTVLKREREVLHVGGPNLGQRRDLNDANITKLQREMSELKLKHESNIQELESRQPKETKCGHEELIVSLKQRISEVEGDNAALVMVNSDLTENIESLYAELSIKEAQWCEAEEQLNMKLRSEWGEKYRAWMEKTENKLAELQQANDYMRTQLKKETPRDDPT